MPVCICSVVLGHPQNSRIGSGVFFVHSFEFGCLYNKLIAYYLYDFLCMSMSIYGHTLNVYHLEPLIQWMAMLGSMI